VTWRNSMVTSARGEAALKREKVGDDASRVDTNHTGREMKKIHAVDSTATNER
jgi:hypothetical protein